MMNRRAAWKLQQHVIEVLEERFPLSTPRPVLATKVHNRINSAKAVQSAYGLDDGAWVLTSVYRRPA